MLNLTGVKAGVKIREGITPNLENNSIVREDNSMIRLDNFMAKCTIELFPCNFKIREITLW